MLIYRGFIGQIDYDNEHQLLIGEVINATDLLEFNGQSADEIRQNFQQCIDEYLAFHKDVAGVRPIPFVGSFTVCLTTDKQDKVIKAAQKQGKSVFQWLNQRVDSDLNRYFAKKIA